VNFDVVTLQPFLNISIPAKAIDRLIGDLLLLTGLPPRRLDLEFVADESMGAATHSRFK
jgi:hypothetical protein